jgi:hypothetical protein
MKKQRLKISCYCPFKILSIAKNIWLSKRYIISSYSMATNMPKIAEMNLRTSEKITIAELQSNISLKGCGITTEDSKKGCGITTEDLKKGCAFPPVSVSCLGLLLLHSAEPFGLQYFQKPVVHLLSNAVCT